MSQAQMLRPAEKLMAFIFGRPFRADLLWAVFPGLKAWAVLSGHFMANWQTPTVRDLSDYCFG
jgi:hypothetical protein